MSRAVVVLHSMGPLIAAAVALLVCALPGVAVARSPHFQAGARAASRGAALRLADGPPRAREGEEWHRGDDWRPDAGDDGGDQRDWDDGGWHGRDRDDDEWHDHWVSRDGDDWGWRADDWDGGEWDGQFWPRAYYGWDYPWILPVVPDGSVTIWFGGVPYYYVNRVYYVWSPAYHGYVVADPPPVAQGDAVRSQQSTRGTSRADSRGALILYAYPRKGQTAQQTANDRFQCHQWAVGQTGFDPTNSANDTQASTATRSNYKRAVTACLEARGYSVR